MSGVDSTYEGNSEIGNAYSPAVEAEKIKERYYQSKATFGASNDNPDKRWMGVPWPKCKCGRESVVKMTSGEYRCGNC